MTGPNEVGPSPGAPSPASEVRQRAPRPDRWAHRRGEPRVFALLWTMYLMGATMLTFATVGVRGQVPVEVYRPAAKMLILSVAVGIAVVWPMVRLCQARPAGSSAWSAMVDFFVVLLPVQAIVWPQTWLTAWPLEVVGAVSALLACWGLLVAGILAWALNGGGVGRFGAGPGPVTRAAGWMGLIVLLAAVGPVAAGALNGGSGAAGLASPLSGVFAITADLPVGGRGRGVTNGQWRTIVAPGVLGGLVWLGAWGREIGRGQRGVARLG